MSHAARISREYFFSAAHHLPFAPEGHKCREVHGHSYKVVVTLEGDVDESTGWVVDFADIDSWVVPLVMDLDHSDLNMTIKNPTAENIALWFAQRVEAPVVVRVYEGPGGWAEVGP